MNRDGVMRWVAQYERARREGDLAAVEQIFTADCHYRPSPYDESEIGHSAIKAFWLDDEDEVFALEADPVAIEDRHAVVRVEVHYGDPVRQEYRDLWMLRFAPDGRVDVFEEWAYCRASHSLLAVNEDHDRRYRPTGMRLELGDPPRTRSVSRARNDLRGNENGPDDSEKRSHSRRSVRCDLFGDCTPTRRSAHLDLPGFTLEPRHNGGHIDADDLVGTTR